MSVREVVTPLVVGALLAALAVGGYLWMENRSEGQTIAPGSFTELEGGALIATEADTIGEPIDVNVEWVDPSDDEAFQRQKDQIEDVDRVLEISTTDIEEGQRWLPTPPDSPFTVALPVPDRFDTSNLVPIGYSYGEYVVPAPSLLPYPNRSDLPDTWTYLDGAFLLDGQMLLVDVPSVGTPDRPTRVGVVEHAYLETPVAHDASAQTGDQTGAPSEAQAASLGGFPVSESSHAGLAAEGQGDRSSQTARFAIHERIQDAVSLGEDMAAVEVDVTGAEGFQITCLMDDCSEDRRIAGHSIRDRVQAVARALGQAVPEFESLQGQQGPSILPSLRQVDPTEQRYPLRLHGPNADGGMSDSQCEEAAGFYSDLWKQASLCLNFGAVVQTDHTIMPALEFQKQATAHELFHAYQFGMQDSGADDTAVLEGTTMLAQGWEDPTSLSGIFWPPQLTRSLTDSEVMNDYRAEYLWHHLYENQGKTFEQTGKLFQAGLELEDADAYINRETDLHGLGVAYWEFAKDLVYEDKGPELRPQNQETDAGTCELYEGEDQAPELPDAITTPHPGALQVDEVTISIPDTLKVDAWLGRDTIEGDLAGLTSDVYRFEYTRTGTETRGLWVRVTLESPGAGADPEMRMKLYDAENEGTQECWEDDEEAWLGRSAGIEVWEGDEEATLLVSNLEYEQDAPSEYQLVFEAFPMWAQTGNNGDRTYWIETDQGKRQVTTMSGPTQFQQDDQPGSLKWSAGSSGGISRPSYAFDQVYTVYGQGGLGGMMAAGSQGSGSLDAPEGKIVAHDAETGEVVWEAGDDDAQLNIGRFIGSGSGSAAGLSGLSGYQHEAIAGNGNVYVPGGHTDEFYPPGEAPPPGSAAYQGVLAFDADDGSLAWEAKPPGQAPHERNLVDQIALDHETLYAKGVHLKFIWDQRTESWHGDATHKLWSIPAGGGDFQEIWSAPYERSKMVMGDGQAIVAGWASPAEITAIDLDTGQAAWSHTDVFNPPPQDEEGNREVYTAAIPEIAYENGTVYTATTIVTPDGTHGAVYAFDEDGQKWRYATDEMSPTPAVNDGTVYAMTGTFNISDEEAPDSPGDVIDRASILHAVDATRNETRWAVNASTTMTVTDDRVYVGKNAPPGDPFGASVAALDTATGQVVWVNEEDVRGPTAWTGAFVDDVLYVNTQMNVVALHG